MWRRQRKLTPADIGGLINLKQGDIALDCGAHVGDVTKQLLATQAQVVAFEPNPYAFDYLQENFAQHHRLELRQQAIATGNATMKLYLHEWAEQDQVKWANGSSLLDFKGNVNTDTYVEVETIDLADYVLSLNKPIAFVKMDIEGAEIEVINHLLDTGAIKQIKLLCAETHEAKIPQLRAPTSALKKRLKKERIKNVRLDWM